MFMGNKTLRGCGESIKYSKEMVQEYIRCSEDICYWASKYFYIVSLDKGKIIIPLWDFQKKVLKACQNPPNGKRHIIILASRQISKTTMISIYMLHKILFNQSHAAAILANKEKTAKDILKKIKLSYEMLPLWMQQGIKNWNETLICLENGSSITAASTASDSIRGMVFNTCLCDEFAFVDRSVQDSFLSSVIPTMSSGKTSQMIFLSTPKGRETFSNMWGEAVRGQSNFYPIKILWNQVPGRDEEWKKNMIKDLPNHEVQFNVEFGCAFIGSSNTLILGEKLEELFGGTVVDTKWNGLMLIYEQPIQYAKYIIGVDVSMGTGADYSVVQVCKINSTKNIEQVAVYRCNTIIPQDFAEVIISISDYYNCSPCMIEKNAECGGILLTTLFDKFEFDRIVHTGKTGLGILASKTTKAESNILLKRYIERAWLKLNDRTTIFELSLYTEKSIGCYSAKQEDHDDCVRSLAWCLYYLITEQYLSEFEQEYGEVSEVSEQYRLGDKPRGNPDFEPVMFFD